MKCYVCDVDCDPPKDCWDEWWHCPKCGREFTPWQEDSDEWTDPDETEKEVT